MEEKERRAHYRSRETQREETRHLPKGKRLEMGALQEG